MIGSVDIFTMIFWLSIILNQEFEHMEGLEARVAALLQTTAESTASGIQSEYQSWILAGSFGILVAMIIVNSFMGRQTASISNRFHTYVVPPGPFFAIWGVIFLTLLFASGYSWYSNSWSLRVHILFAISNCLNAAWVLVFKLNHRRANQACLLILGLLFAVNEWQWLSLVQLNLPPTGWNTFVLNVFAFYQGWLTGAFNLNLGTVLVHSMGLPKRQHLYLFWVITPLCVVGMCWFNLQHTELRNTLGLFISAIYALIGAAITSKKCLGGDERPYVRKSGKDHVN